MCSALDLPEQDNEPGRPYIAFLATEVTPKAASTQIKKGTWPSGPLPSVRSAPHPWPFVDRFKPIIWLGEQDKPNVTHTYERVNIYGTGLMASESVGVEQKPHDGDKQVTVLVDRGALGNYFDDQRISQFSTLQEFQPPSLDFTEGILHDSYVSSEDMLRDVRDYTAALDFNINIPADRCDLHSKFPRRGASPSGGATPEEPVP